MQKKIMIFDTNALLDIYQYTNETIEKIVNYFNNQKEYDLYLSSIVYEEYNKHYLEARSKSGNKNPILKFRSKFRSFHDSTLSKIDELIRDRSYKGYKSDIESKLSEVKSISLQKLTDINNEIDSLYADADIGYTGEDLVFDLVESIKQKCNPKHYNIHEKIEMSIIADQRIKLNFRPGLTDLNKDGLRKYGDIFIWLDTIRIAKEYDEVVFVENEVKLDWWKDDNYNAPADNIIMEWNEIYLETKKFTMSRLDTLLLNNAFNYLDGDHQLEISHLASDFMKSLKTKSMFDSNNTADKLYDYAPSDLDHLLLGQQFNGGNIDEVEIIEMLEPVTLIDNVDFQYDSTTRTLFAESQVKIPYLVRIVNSFGRYSTPDYYTGTIYILFKCEFEFYLITNGNLEYYLNSVIFDNKNVELDLNELKGERFYDE